MKTCCCLPHQSGSKNSAALAVVVERRVIVSCVLMTVKWQRYQIFDILDLDKDAGD